MLPAPGRCASLLLELPVVLAALSLFFALISLARYWSGPVNTQTVIQLDPVVLPKYAFYSVARIMLAYLISLVVAVAYGYVAARNAKAERVLIPLLDILQSIPVLSFLPGVMVAMVAVSPTTIGREGNGFDFADLYRPGLEYRVQLLFVAAQLFHAS